MHILLVKKILGRSEQSGLFHVFCSEYKPSGWKLKTVNLDKRFDILQDLLVQTGNLRSLLLLPITHATITFISRFMHNIKDQYARNMLDKRLKHLHDLVY